MLSNAAREPEIEDLQGFLNTCGAEITGAGTSTVVIRGRTAPPRRYLHHSAGPHRGGYLPLRGGLRRGRGLSPGRTGGAPLRRDGGAPGSGVRRDRRQRRNFVPPYRTIDGAPAHPHGPLSRFSHRRAGHFDGGTAAVPGERRYSRKTLFSSRYRHVDELARMGADIRVSGRTAVVLGVERLHGAAVRCTDLRGGAALCAAALAAEGETSVSDITHIDRGYQSIEDDLAALGADIRRVEETASP